MIHVVLPDNSRRRLVFYLAMEEYVSQNIKTLTSPGAEGIREAFFIWQVVPTVIFGRNQVMEAEVNLPWCREHGVELYRRKSGGGCVYADLGNIMVSYISDCTDVAKTFDRFLSNLSEALRRLGLDASRSGRNDVLVCGKKVSGNAFFLQPTSSIVHGTLLFDSDFDALEMAITPSDAKIKSKGVSSVRKHVTNVHEELRQLDNPNSLKYDNIENFKEYIVDYFCPEKQELILSPSDMKAIEEIEAGYLDPAFLQGRNHSFTFERSGRIEGVGTLNLEFVMEGETISSCHLAGDYFQVGQPVDEMLDMRLKGCRCNREEVSKALSGTDLSLYVLNLSNRAFLDFAFNDAEENEGKDACTKGQEIADN